MATQSLIRLGLESSNYERGLRQAQRQLNDFTRSIGINMKSLSGMAVAAGAVTTATKVLTDAFFKNEQQLDEWGRTVQSCESLYSGFLNSLNNGDIGGFLSNIDKIISAARTAYDALDELATFNAFNQVNVEKTRTGMTEAIADYRMGGGTKDAVKAAGEAYKKELQDRRRLEKEAYLETIGRIAAERGVNKKDLIDAMSGSYGHYQDLKKQGVTGKKSTYISTGPGMGTFSALAVPANDLERLGIALRQLNDKELEYLQGLGAQAERTGNEIANVDKQIARVLNGRGTSGGGGGGGRKAKGTEMVSMNLGGIPGVPVDYTAGLGGLPTTIDASPLTMMEDRLKSLTEAQNTFGRASAEAWQAYQERIDAVTESIDVFKGKKIENAAEASANSFQAAASAISSVGSALSQIDDPAAKVIGIVAQAIGTVAQAFAQALSSDKTTKGNIWAFIGAAAASTAAMITMISSIHSATGYAQGGVIPGNSFSGDNQWARVNAGETILTRGQSAIVASALNNSMNGMVLGTVISGEDIKIVLNRNSRRTGNGEYVTSKRM